MAGGDTLRDTEATHFGFREVPLAEKQALVDDVFATVARRYDLMNDLMSGGLHRLWKDAMVNTLAAPKSSRPFRLVDVGGGTGDISFRVVEARRPRRHLHGVRHQSRDAEGRRGARPRARDR